MPTYSTPGVYVNESALVSLTPNVSGATAAVFFGESGRGPTTPTLITDWPSYRALFGELDNNYDLGYAVYHYFANGGRACYVNRVVGAASATATRAAVPFYPAGGGNASASLFTATATSAGTWANSMTLQFTAGNVVASASVKPTFGLSILIGGVEVEKWLELSPDENSSRYFYEVLNRYSKFVRVSNPHAFTQSTAGASVGVVFYTSATVTLAGGTSVAPATSDYTTAFDGVDLVPGNLLMNAVGITTPAVVGSLVTKAATRGDSFVIIDPALTDTTFAQLQTTGANFAGLASGGYAAAYAPALEMVDPAKTGPAAIRTTYPGGAMAGLYIRTEVERTVAKAPAGYAADVRGALGLSVRLTDSQVGQLYDGTPSINTFKAVAGAGVVANGTRTLEKTNPDKYIPVRRTLNYVKRSLKDLTAYAVFEPNDERLWNSISNQLSAFLTNFWRSGGLKGDRSTDAFFVLCDKTNNTAQTIDQGIVNVSVGVALSYPAEFIVINVSQWTGGSNAAESSF
jgi:phage tail sheath protein FI